MIQFDRPGKQNKRRSAGQRTKGVEIAPPIQPLLSKETYAQLHGNPGNQKKSEHQKQIEDHLEHYAFLKEEIEQLGESREGRGTPKGMQDNIYKALRALHKLEQLIFKWKKTVSFSQSDLEMRTDESELGINLRLLDEIQEERAFVTYYLRFYGLGLMPSYKYGLMEAPNVLYPEALQAVMHSTKREANLFLMHAEGDGKTHNETIKNRLMANIGQLMAFPTGVKILSFLAQNMSREGFTPSLNLTAQSPPGKIQPEMDFNAEEDSLSIDTSWKASSYFVQVRQETKISPLKRLLKRKKNQPLTFTTPYLQLARLLDSYAYAKKGVPKSRADQLIKEDMIKLYNEAGLETPDNLEMLKASSGFESIQAPDGSGNTTGRANSIEAPEMQFDAPQKENSQESGLSTRRNMSPKNRQTIYGLRRPIGPKLQKDQEEIDKLTPSLGFSTQDIDFSTFHILGEQGAYGSVYGFRTLSGEERIMKFVSVSDEYKLAFSRNPEKEAFASNFIKSLGQRVDAPATLAIGKEEPYLDELREQAARCPNPETRASLKKDIALAKKRSYRYSCLVMEKVAGVTRNQLMKEYGTASGHAQLQRVAQWADYQAAMGELYVYDLVLGNYDRFWMTIHGGNAMFNVKMDRYRNNGAPKVVPQEGKPINAIDQTLSSYGQHMMVRYLRDQQFVNQGKNATEKKANNIKFSMAGKTAVEAEDLPFHFQSQTQTQLSFIRKLFKQVLDSLMKKDLGKSMPIHFMQTILGEEDNFRALEIGMVEAMLQLRNKRDMLRAFSKVQYSEFSHDADYLFETCQMVDDLVSSYGEGVLEDKLEEEKFHVRGL
ncbi:MAG: hypothetical protein MI784_04810 [Cytophagales bacterium]|nr:hypothetical protein [Cytophagales bacterium]